MFFSTHMSKMYSGPTKLSEDIRQSFFFNLLDSRREKLNKKYKLTIV